MEETKRLQIIEKIKKLLRLAKSSNEHEAALAAAKAQELLSTYNLNDVDFSEREIPKEVGLSSSEIVKKPPNWVFLLSSSVAGAFDSRCYFHPHGYMCFVGVDIDHEVASFTFAYLYRTIGRLATQFMGKSQQRRLTTKGKKKIRLSYCLGCADVISQKLNLQKQKTPITTTALVPVKHALIQAKMDAQGVSSTQLEDEDLSDRAYWCGKRDGAQVDSGRRAIKGKKERQLRIKA